MATLVVPIQTSPVEDAEALRKAFKGIINLYIFNIFGYHYDASG